MFVSWGLFAIKKRCNFFFLCQQNNWRFTAEKKNRPREKNSRKEIINIFFWPQKKEAFEFFLTFTFSPALSIDWRKMFIFRTFERFYRVYMKKEGKMQFCTISPADGRINRPFSRFFPSGHFSQLHMKKNPFGNGNCRHYCLYLITTRFGDDDDDDVWWK